MSWVGKVAKIGGMVGTIIPAALLIILGIVYLATGGHSNMDFHSNFFPDFSKFDNLVLAASIFLFSVPPFFMTVIHSIALITVTIHQFAIM